MTKTCAHRTVIYPDDAAFNKARQQEQRELRQPGEVFVLKFRETCAFCGEKTYVEKTLRRKI